MFIRTFKINKKILYIAIAVLVVAIVLAIVLPTRNSTTMAQTGISFKDIEDNDDRRALLKKFGWEVDDKEESVQDIELPLEFDDTYNSYNKLQQNCGLDLLPYAGKCVKLYTYVVLNYPDKDVGTVFANLIIDGNNVIGADITQAKAGGFMKGIDSYLN